MEKVKRLQPTGDTLRELFLKSGNLCAFPDCDHLMMNAKGVFIAQVCHIEAADEGGERFNPNMTNEERRHVSNLMLMCYPHHKETNDVAAYPVAKLKKMKQDHENRFSNPDRAILEKLGDRTLRATSTVASNLKRMNRVLEWGFSDEELATAARELGVFAKRFQKVPLESRKFLSEVVKRIDRMAEGSATRGGNQILASDVEEAFGLSDTQVASHLKKLDAYGLATLGQIDNGYGDEPSIMVSSLKGGWPLWQDLVEFCKKTSEPVEAFTIDMDFARLDE
ncbi:hypothetical protein [Ramlibacter alkalitolerans]|uniref:HNH endonuclease n=1 Tax=Ramlibacter alkalitolerans TaxID=2039631 RepID=A0ABS1JX25_9BURK|nr:hypothetical protein [Ramlibacter alkalitolerans]MBL0428759.1 hypothetical protein [Ramlibacter alkalitolerans]